MEVVYEVLFAIKRQDWLSYSATGVPSLQEHEITTVCNSMTNHLGFLALFDQDGTYKSNAILLIGGLDEYSAIKNGPLSRIVQDHLSKSVQSFSVNRRYNGFSDHFPGTAGEDQGERYHIFPLRNTRVPVRSAARSEPIRCGDMDDKGGVPVVEGRGTMDSTPSASSQASLVPANKAQRHHNNKADRIHSTPFAGVVAIGVICAAYIRP